MGGNYSSKSWTLQLEAHVSRVIHSSPRLPNYFRHPDPFYVKEEFAPSDKAALTKRQQAAHNLLAPHSRLLQFLGSHFNAIRLGSPHTEKVFIRLLKATLDGLKYSTGHPLAREIRFQIVLFGLKVLRHSIGMDFGARCLLKDRLLSAALSWFSFPPQWSFGGNRLQLKAETRLLADLSIALRNVQMVADKPGPLLKTMQAKEKLLQILIDSEISRLAVWLYPINNPQEIYLSNVAAKGTAEVRASDPQYQLILTQFRLLSLDL
jgi:phosphatidylinositol 4-kinase